MYPIIKHPLQIIFSSQDVPTSAVRMAVSNSVDNALLLSPGCSWRMKEEAIHNLTKLSSKSLLLKVPLFIDQDGQPSTRIVVDIKVNYAPLAVTLNVDKLFISNEPEEVEHPGVVLRATMKKEKTALLLFYHKNKSGQKMDALVRVVNPGDRPARLLLFSGFGGPSSDGMCAGHLATSRFFNMLKDNTGVYFTVPPHSTRIISRLASKDGQIVSGLMKVIKLAGSQLVFDILMTDQNSEAFANHILYEKEDKGHIGGIFPGDYKHIEKKYIISNDILNIRVGDSPYLKDVATLAELQGNYGQLHKIDLKLVNNYKVQKKVQFFFVSSGGIARGVFLCNNQVLETGLLNPKVNSEPSAILSVDVEGNTAKTISLVTMPQPGSFYPVNIVVKTED